MSILKAKTKPAAESYIDLLVVPPKPASLIAAEAALIEATAARETGQQAHVEAMRLLERQVAGQPQQITRCEVDTIGATLAALFSTEDEAKAALDAETASYRDSTVSRLLDGLSELSDAIGEKLNDLDKLLDPAMLAAAEVRKGGFHLPNSLLPQLGSLRSSIEDMRRTLWESRRHANWTESMPQAAWRRQS